MKLYWIIAVSELVSLLCIFHLWRRKTGMGIKVLWSLIMLIPLIGPILYGAFDPPAELQNPNPRGPDQQLDSLGPIMRDVGWKESEHDDD